ncbi:MAG: LL-diaminopimelate aminotransferase, partial [Verrucomicrobia bacterium]
PKEVQANIGTGEFRSLHPLWNRRFSTKFNGVGYPVQCGAAALYTPEGKAQVSKLIEHYMGNAQILRKAVMSGGLSVYGGLNAPYIWVKGPEGNSSWDLFDRILKEVNIVVTPGSGFGEAGEGYFRISAFNSRSNAQEAARRFQEITW